MYTQRKDCSSYLVLLTIAIIFSSVASGTPQFCPNFCKCDLYNDHNRADCSAKRLISPNIELPPAVEVLDLSYNDITNLDKNCFQNFHYLLNLTISHNAIHTLDLDTFTPLRRISAIDLSYNRLEYLDERLFETNRQLTTLNLEGNKFMSLPNKPLLRSSSLHTLNLCNSQLTYITKELLKALPQLQHLDVSRNLMISLDLVALNALQQLETLKLDGNRWICDQSMKQIVDTLQRRHIDVELTDCAASNELQGLLGHMFERMEMLEPQEEKLLEVLTEPPSLSEIWHVPKYDGDDDEDDDVNRFNIMEPDWPLDYEKGFHMEKCYGSKLNWCRRYDECLKKIGQLLEDEQNGKGGLYTYDDMRFVLLVGNSMGIAVTIFVISCAMCVKDWYRDHKRQRENRRNALSDLLPSRVATRPAPLPPTQPAVPSRSRRSRRHAPSSTTQYRQPESSTRGSIVRSDGRDNFLSRLFGRPQRHQYYRAINQNTATLIRRLSRSNLFNNRLSQHFTDRERNTPSAPSSPSSPSAPAHFDYSLERETASSSIRVERPETPPPLYDVVVKKDYNQK